MSVSFIAPTSISASPLGEAIVVRPDVPRHAPPSPSGAAWGERPCPTAGTAVIRMLTANCGYDAHAARDYRGVDRWTTSQAVLAPSAAILSRAFRRPQSETNIRPEEA